MNLVRLRGTFTDVIQDTPMMELTMMAMCMSVLLCSVVAEYLF